MYYNQPRFFSNFKCVGSSCPDNCCYGWTITWTKDEVEKLLNAEGISDELFKLVKESFYPTENSENRLRIVFGVDGKCPFQTEEKLCKIQRELGAEFLSETCTIYPRYMLRFVNTFYRSCRTSCPVVVETLLKDRRSMELVSVYENGSADKLYEDKEHVTDIFEFFYELLSDDTLEIERSIMLGSLAAERLTQTIGREDFESVPEELRDIRKLLHEKNTLDVVNNVKPNLRAKLSFLPAVTERITGSTVTQFLHDEEGIVDLELYKHGEERLRETLKGREYFLRNLALCLMLDMYAPFKLRNKTLFENYGLFVATFACIKLNIISALAIDRPVRIRLHGQEFQFANPDDKIIGFTALISREFFQNDPKPPIIVDLMNEHNYIDHAHLAALVI